MLAIVYTSFVVVKEWLLYIYEDKKLKATNLNTNDEIDLSIVNCNGIFSFNDIVLVELLADKRYYLHMF